jgi:formate hydrogenlyase subunit 3/multisubunit Na+/H+ antiporter MnhD subunit
MSENLLPLLIVLPLIGGSLSLFGKLYPAVEGLSRVLATLTLAAGLGGLLYYSGSVFAHQELRYALGGWPEPLGIALVMDGFAFISVLLILTVSLLVAVHVLGEKKEYGASFFFFFLLLVAGMTGVALTGDLFTMFVSFEIVAIAAYVLIAWEKSPMGLMASFKYLILSSTGILFFLFGIFLIYRDLGTLSISGIGAAVRASRQLRDAPAVHLALASLCVGIGVRTAFIPFHTWLPEAHAYAPHPVSALLSGVLIKVSFFAMVRLLLQFGGGYLYPLLLWIGAVTSLAAVLSALAQSDAKRLLAFHSISQMGYILAVFGAGSSIALTASFAHAVNHALFKSLLFLTVGIAVQRTGERNLYRMRPLGRELPLVAAAFYVGALSISGMPPFNGYASKALISAGMKGSPAYILLMLTSFGTVASFIKLGRIYLPGAAKEKTASGPGAAAILSILALSLLCLAAGILGTPMAGTLHRLLYRETFPISMGLFGPAELLSAFPVLLAGIPLYFLVVTKTGKRLAGTVKSMAPDLHTVLTFFFAGLLLFAAAAYI